MKTITLNLRDKEYEAVVRMAEEADMTMTQVLKHALRIYDLVRTRQNAGETIHFSGDKERTIQFVGPGFN